MGGRTLYSPSSGEGPVSGCCEHGNELNSSVFWVITLRKTVLKRRFEITYRSHLEGSFLSSLKSLIVKDGTV